MAKHFVSETFIYIAMFALFAMSVAITIEVVSRYIFHGSLSFIHPLVEKYFMVALVFLGICHTYANNDHIKFELIARYASPKASLIIELCVNTLILALFSAIFVVSYQSTYESWIYGDTTGGAVSMPLVLSYVWVALGAIGMMGISCVKIWSGLRAWLVWQGSNSAQE